MARVLKVSVSGFYDYLRRTTPEETKHREEITMQVKKIFTSSNATYGYRRVHAGLVLVQNNTLVSVDMMRNICAIILLLVCINLKDGILPDTAVTHLGLRT